MPSPRHLLTTLLVCFLVAFGVSSFVSPKPWREPCEKKTLKAHTPVPPVDESNFHQLLNSVSQESLHDLLHRYFPNRYKHGVYDTDQSALEAVHRADAALATSIVRIARRQATNTTISSTSNPPPQTTTTTTSQPPPDTTIATTTDTTAPPVDTSGTIITTTSTSENPDVTPGPTPDTTENGTTKISGTPVKPITSTFTSVINGTPVLVTQTSYVGVDGQALKTSTKPTGSLQTNAAAAPHRGGAVLEVVIGVVVGGAMLV